MNYFNKLYQQLKFKFNRVSLITSNIICHNHSLKFIRNILSIKEPQILRFDMYITFSSDDNELVVMITQSSFWETLNLIGLETDNEKQIILYLQKNYGNHIDKLNAFITLEKYLNYPKRINFNKYLLLS